MIIIAGHIKTDPSQVEELARVLRFGREKTRTEDGCLAYEFALDEKEAGTVLVYERWRDQASLDTQLAQPEVGALLGGWADKIEIQVRIFDASNERGFTA